MKMQNKQTLYKLTTQDNLTRPGESNETLWGPDVTHKTKTKGNSKELCSSRFIHVYLSPELAILLNPIHAQIKNPKLWKAKGKVKVSDGQLKVGCKKLTTLKEIELLEISDTQKIAFAILCAKEVCSESSWNQWADGWLSGKDRSKESTYAATYAAVYAVYAAYAATYAAYAATYARADAVDTAYAAYWAARAKKDLDLIEIAEKAVKEY